MGTQRRLPPGAITSSRIVSAVAPCSLVTRARSLLKVIACHPALGTEVQSRSIGKVGGRFGLRGGHECVEMGKKHGADLPAVGLGIRQILVNMALRVNDDGGAHRLIGDERGRMGQIIEISTVSATWDFPLLHVGGEFASPTPIPPIGQHRVNQTHQAIHGVLLST